jgi:hypothetical protein
VGNNNRPRVLVLLSNDDLQLLTPAQKAAYLSKAVEALQTGRPIVTPNGPFEPLDEPSFT